MFRPPAILPGQTGETGESPEASTTIQSFKVQKPDTPQALRVASTFLTNVEVLFEEDIPESKTLKEIFDDGVGSEMRLIRKWLDTSDLEQILASPKEVVIAVLIEDLLGFYEEKYPPQK